LKEKLTEEELKDITQKEGNTLKLIRTKAKTDESIGAILIEPIVGPLEFTSIGRNSCSPYEISVMN
jgi:hypothetical protein